MHFEVLVEEQSAEEALKTLLPKLGVVDFRIHSFQGKPDLLARLPQRLAGYAPWLPSDWRIVVLLDEDREDCCVLKERMETAARGAGLRTPEGGQCSAVYVLNRIAVEEVEAWFFGDVEALCAAYPGVSTSLANRAPYRDPDAIRGGTWEALERVLKRAGYYPAGLPKIEVARQISTHMDPKRNRSRSFQTFRSGIARLLANG